ncbi:MAG: cyclic nucleotide-binding domain-containing protein [Spirochaetia bacterium]|jgi:signal transduction histidine kinase
MRPGSEGRSEFLRGIHLFAGLSAADLEKICNMLKEVRLAAGAELFSEGSAGDSAYLIRQGEIEITRLSDGRQVPLAVRRQGEMVGEMAILEQAPRMASARALTDCVLLAIGREQMDQLISSSPSAARVLLATVTARLRETQALLQQSEKMAQLGVMTAGLAHELNNPSAAALRSAEHLKHAAENLVGASVEISRLGIAADRVDDLERRIAAVRAGASQQNSVMAVDLGDRQDLLEEWLAQRGITDAGADVPDLAGMGYGTADLEELQRLYPSPQFRHVIRLICAAWVTETLLKEIGAGARQVSEIVKALKNYVYLDQGPVQEVDIHEGLENTLIILRHKLQPGITVRREFAPDLPRVPAHGSELNQVWTNLIDNAADALEGKGEIILRTRRKDGRVIVEVEDNGKAGIPQEAKARIFTLFFTTKPLGKGTGQGLNISYAIVRRHGGTIEFDSRPGRTVFAVKLPVRSPVSVRVLRAAGRRT